MLKRVEKFLIQEQLVKKNSKILVGISGGADSVCLLLVLKELEDTLGIQIVAAHLNHNLRGEESQRDEKFVDELCRRMGISLHKRSLNVEKYAKSHKVSMEEAGRNVRRAYFEQLCVDLDADAIALGHHINDNVETSIMNQARGTGLVGLAGIRPKQGIYIRPLLCVMRDEIESYLEAKKQAYCVDSSNSEDGYTRNRVRNHILPQLVEGINQQAVENINNLLGDTRLALDYIHLQADVAYAKMVNESKVSVCLNLVQYEKEHPLIRVEVIKKMFQYINGNSKDISRAHMCAVQKLCKAQVGKELNLPNELVVKRIQRGLEMRRATDWASESQINCIELVIPGKTLISENLVIHSSVGEYNGLENIVDTHYTKYFDYDIIKDKLYVDNIHMGDHIIINEQGGRQSMKKFCTNQKIDAHMRSSVLNIVSESYVLWILGYRRAHIARVTSETKRILKIQIGGKEDDRKN